MENKVYNFVENQRNHFLNFPFGATAYAFLTFHFIMFLNKMLKNIKSFKKVL